MGVGPGYGETPLDPQEADALTPQAREIFGDEPKKIDLLADILTDAFLRDLHQKLYGDLWTWAGRYRTRDLNIGVEPERIAVELRGSLDNIRYRWEHTDDWTARELGIVVHAEIVRIHGFVDGNGRTTRLLADLVFPAVQDSEAIAATYDWEIDKRQYIAVLRQYDLTRKLRGTPPIRGFARTGQAALSCSWFESRYPSSFETPGSPGVFALCRAAAGRPEA